MTKQDIITLLAYDQWATNLQLNVATGLSEEQYARDLKSSHGGIRGTFVHTYGAELLWLARWNGGSPTAIASSNEIPDLPLLRERWNALWKELAGYIDLQNEEILQQPTTYKDLRGNSHTQPLIHQLQHVFNHSTYHRGQITTMFRQLEITPVATDMIAYYRTLQS